MFLGVSSYSVGPLTASAFSIVVLGGLGSVSGSLIAAYVVGYLETLTAYLISPAYRHDSAAAAAGRRHVCAAAGPVRPEVSMRALSSRACSGSRIAALAVGALLPTVASGYVLGLLTVAFYTAVFAMSWDLLFGFAGEVNFGPTFLIGLGAYTAGILDARLSPGISIWLCVLAGAAAAVIGGVVLALPALRLRGPYFGLTTLVAVLMLQNFVVVFAGLTGGEIGLSVPDVISDRAPARTTGSPSAS